MRFLSACAVTLALAGCAGPSDRRAVLPPGERAGCVGTDLTACVTSLAAAMWFDPAAVAVELARRNELDVNGKPATRTVLIGASFPGRIETIPIALHLAAPGPNDTVVKAAAALPRVPTDVHTVREYDETFLYDVVATLLGNRCPDSDRLKFYQFFENTVKPRLVSEKIVERPGIFSHTMVRSHADRVPYCGVKFSYSTLVEWDGELMSKAMRSLKSGATIVLE